MIETWLTRQFELTIPIVGAPMAGPGEGALAAAVSAGGGLGMIGVGASRSAVWIRDQASHASAINRTYGVGLMAWTLDRDDTQLETVIDLRPALVSISFGTVEPYVRRVLEAGIHVATQVGNLDEALRAEQAGVDFLVARGGEAGGHGRNEVATLSLLQSVIERVEVPVVAAGGIGTARDLAAVIAAGAVGAWVGTALLTTHEANNTQAARRRLLAAADTDTAYGRVFDIAQHLGWPPEFGARSLRNTFFDHWHQRLDDLANNDAAAEELDEARRRPDDEDAYDIAYIYAGQGVGTLTQERPVADVLADLGKAESLLGPHH
ncbi:MAG: nitronate monooxygenase [Marmoricola sp.]